MKLRKIVKVGATVQYEQSYLGGLEYRKNGTGSTRVEAVYHAEGRYLNLNAEVNNTLLWQKEYTLKDHLGNARISFTDKNANGIVDVPSDIVQENHYYPFGLNYEGAWRMNDAARDNKYQYNSKEWNDDFGLNLYAYGARYYDAAIGRFTGVDPIADQFAWVSPYNYAENEPVGSIDLWGLQKVAVSKVQQQVIINIQNSKNLDVRHQTACYPTTWKYLTNAYKDARLNGPTELITNKGKFIKDNINSNTGRWYPTGNSDFRILAASEYANEKWNDLPEKYRGEGLAGAMSYAGFADEPQNAWDGNLQPGAVLQMWNSKSDYEGIKSGEGYDTKDIDSRVRELIGTTPDNGHSAIFSGYKKAFGIITGIEYVDQKGKQSISRLSPTFSVIRGSNIKDKKEQK